MSVSRSASSDSSFGFPEPSAVHAQKQRSQNVFLSLSMFAMCIFSLRAAIVGPPRVPQDSALRIVFQVIALASSRRMRCHSCVLK